MRSPRFIGPVFTSFMFVFVCTMQGVNPLAKVMDIDRPATESVASLHTQNEDIRTTAARTNGQQADRATTNPAKPGDLICAYQKPLPRVGDSFGNSEAIMGNKIIIGAWCDSSNAERAGAVYVFEATTGRMLYSLKDPAPEKDGQFGRKVAVMGQNIVVGVANKPCPTGPNSGVIYIFDGESGCLKRTIVNPTPGPTEEFGRDIAILGNQLLTGAGWDQDGLGTAYLFDGPSGQLVNTIPNPTNINNAFGVAVAAVGTDALIGASNGAWRVEAQTSKRLVSIHQPEWDKNFEGPTRVAALGNDLLVGAPFVDALAGAVYLYDGRTGKLLRTLRSPTPTAREQFGDTICVAGKYILVGSRYVDESTHKRVGRVYVFDGPTGVLVYTFKNPSSASEGRFGCSIATMGETILIGDMMFSEKAPGAGIVYSFRGFP